MQTAFFSEVSYEVSILSLIVISGHRFYEVASSMQARVQSRRTCIILLILTWVFSIAMSSPWLVFLNFDLKYQNCFSELSTLHSRMGHSIFITLLLPPPTRHVGSVPRDYCQAKATEDSGEIQLFSSCHKDKETELPLNNNVPNYNCGFYTLPGSVHNHVLN